MSDVGISNQPFRRRMTVILEYEPSWFSEFMSGTAIFLWAIFGFATTVFQVGGDAWILPAVGVVVGPFRLALLVNLDARPRVLAAMFGFVWWACISYALETSFGRVQFVVGFIALALGDALTVGKFSLAYLRKRNDGAAL